MLVFSFNIQIFLFVTAQTKLNASQKHHLYFKMPKVVMSNWKQISLADNPSRAIFILNGN